jgi:hypothetical protein
VRRLVAALGLPMTVAVCLNCGEFKHGAFNPCLKCKYTPNDDESLTKHLLVTDHYHSAESLKAISDRVKSGQPIHFDPATLREAWVSKKQLDEETKQLKRGCTLILLVVGVVILSGVLVAAYFLS